MLVLLLLLAAIGVLALMMTGEGGWRRGESVPVAVLAGVSFPITWAVWYVRDEHLQTSYGRSNP
jgi:hypothetical protein